MTDSLYKIYRPFEWDAFQDSGTFAGSEHDLRDGFIHMCSAAQLGGTLAKHFSQERIVILARFYADKLETVKWEVSRGGEKFPHIYGTLTLRALDGYLPLSQRRHTGFTIPESFLGAT